LSFFKRHEIIKELAVRNPAVEYCSIGSSNNSYGAYVQSLQHRKPANYRIIANAEYAEIRNYLETSLVYVHAAANEHFGIAILEAMCAGAVPLAHDSGGMREILPMELRWTDISELSRKSNEFLQDENLWNRWHRKVIEIAAEHSPQRFKEQVARETLRYE
jgi:glycosyltransferase involved in cell wall biosynthesis